MDKVVNPMGEERNRMDRILFLYDKLISGDIVYKQELAAQFDVHERTIRRDIQDIKYYMARFYINKDVIYDPKVGGYQLMNADPTSFSWSRWLALSQIILDDHWLNQDESQQWIHFISSRLNRTNRKRFLNYLQSTVYHQSFPKWKNPILEKVDLVYEALSSRKKLQIAMHDQLFIFCPVGLVYKHSHFFIAACVNESFQQGYSSSPNPVPIMIQDHLSIKMAPQSFVLPSSFHFDEQAFKQRCMPP
ncbi:HTH domain-containing protein [Sporolactobacillus shoreicorticis]|uniref:Helix-turn-helix transcriptional regulator n=1 Tax=Sporolactobacillus shoreicorticis TaxID=1923877 RepID=A0ABW5S857_9BACL|nr:HTH domain-containing protein [Sporolactobacillus shoreicorticis]MCO7126058.1 HTH domain-containing protein [Sporolactobacillus shoreicorticis]